MHFFRKYIYKALLVAKGREGSDTLIHMTDGGWGAGPRREGQMVGRARLVVGDAEMDNQLKERMREEPIDGRVNSSPAGQ